ncbi:hypothetical protein ECFRIK1996_1695 [Escherichia coli FRIK1996]|nr:hypothetical protein ECFRIK1996_1695 [Escherichia coli FRIK1996]
MLTALKREFFLCVRGGAVSGAIVFFRRMIPPPGAGHSPMISSALP